jgi:branched-chain amino acid aminotransferase
VDLSKHAFFEGKIVPLSEAKISIATHGFLYGTAVFGGMRAYWNEDKKNLSKNIKLN